MPLSRIELIASDKSTLDYLFRLFVTNVSLEIGGFSYLLESILPSGGDRHTAGLVLASGEYMTGCPDV